LFGRRTFRIAFVTVFLVIALVGGIIWQNRPIVWSAQTQLTHGSGDSRLVDLVPEPSGNALHLTWEDTRDNAAEVYYKRSLDNGVTWGSDIKLSDLGAGNVEPEPRVGTDGKTVLVFFSNETPAGERIFFVSSTDSGTNFSQPTQLTDDSGDQSDAAVAFVGITVHLVYQDYFNNGDERVLYMSSQNAGLTWQHEVVLTDNPGAQDRYVAIAAAGNNVVVTWCRFFRNQEAIYVRSSVDSGTSWKPEIQASDYGPPSYLDFPDVASDGTEVHLVWVSQGIQYSRSSDSGSTWSSPVPITNTTRQYLAPRLNLANSKVQLVVAAILTNGTPPSTQIDSEVQYLTSSDGGQSWTKPTSLTTHKFGMLSLAPVIRSRGDASFVAWEDNRNGRLAVFFLSKPDFEALRHFEWQLIASITVSLAVTVVVYFVLARRTFRTNRRARVRKRRPISRNRYRRKSRVRNRTK
jgi:hypothetical protein